MWQALGNGIFLIALIGAAIYVCRAFDDISGRGPKQIDDGLRRHEKDRNDKRGGNQ